MIWIGTSGYNYPEWKGSFYPANLPAAKMLPYYAARFPTVEINYTFYRMPNEKLVGGWAAQTPSPYKLTLKAPRRITHDSRLQELRRARRQFLPGRRHARRQARRAAVPAAAQSQEGPGAVRRVPRRAAAEGPRGVRVPPPVVARRRGVRAAARRETSRCASPTARSCRRRCGSPPTTRISGCATKATRRDDIERWADDDRARDGALPRRVRLLQARRRGEGAGVRARMLMERLGVESELTVGARSQPQRRAGSSSPLRVRRRSSTISLSAQ